MCFVSFSVAMVTMRNRNTDSVVDMTKRVRVSLPWFNIWSVIVKGCKMVRIEALSSLVFKFSHVCFILL